MAEDEMVGYHHNSMDLSLNNPWELVIDREAWHATSPWGCKDSDTTE